MGKEWGMNINEMSPARVHLLDDKDLVYVVVQEKVIFDKLPFSTHNGEIWEKAVMMPDGRGVIFQYVESE